MNDQTTQFPRAGARGSSHPALRPESRSLTTRIMHLLLLLLVLNQLIGSQFMRRPLPGDDPAWPFLLHQYAGLVCLGVVLAFWLWTLLRHGETRFDRLFPWLSPAQLRDVAGDLSAQLRHLSHARFPDDGNGALASAVHGLGLLTVTAMAMTGAVYFFADGAAAGHTALLLHKLLANLMWAYLIAHAGVAALHQLFGADMLSRMFWSRRR